ncbi:dipeptidase PepE [Weeksellaceae bacterium KMM 9713]|uniref:Dipeptidase PepE n=1 Tax=Profundicola chukchiensis TaxID=2961959 RepID=A0A9X4N2T9_9FLAO|nr:dipeptidase PepE [Profundicola chukchiensis]MDG4945879.1 dipeptidase PepE [Profundicola chukchiensis]
MKNFILASTSTVYGSDYLAYLKDEVADLFQGVSEIVFVPYARPSGVSHDEYTQVANKFFNSIGIKAVGLHSFDNPKEAIANAKGIFTGGGNTFLLLKTLYELDLIEVLRNQILGGTPYLGTSAGSNIAGLNIRTTNDMPIVYPPSFDAMDIIPFNINPHYLDPDPTSKHKGETRETRILEFLTQNDTTVIGIREGNWIRGKGDQLTIEGKLETRIFQTNKDPYEIAPGTDLLKL